jgi:hypothetical protein
MHILCTNRRFVFHRARYLHYESVAIKDISTTMVTNFKNRRSNDHNTSRSTDDSSQELFAHIIKPYFQKSPVLVKGFYNQSSKMPSSRWKDLQYLKDKIGSETTCMVEIGGSYSNFAQGTMDRPDISFGDYISYLEMFEEKYGQFGKDVDAVHLNDIPTQDLVYLAQNDLKSFPNLIQEFDVPEIVKNDCYKVGKGTLYNMMLWFGPRGCQSPLHYDPLDNLLIQFVGRKNVYLLPNSTDQEGGVHWHYCGYEGQQYNTSPVDAIHPDLEKYPLFKDAPTIFVAELYEGDILYIPSKWWHQVISIDRSISINAWWR